MSWKHALVLLILSAGLPAWAAGCATDSAADQTGASEHSLRSGDQDRSYTVYVPPSAPSNNRNLVVGLHGGLGTGEIFAKQAELYAAADKYGMVLLLPDGYKRTWNAGNCCGPAMEAKIDDVAFIRAAIQAVKSSACIGNGAVFATGFSNGSMLIHRIMVEAPGTFDAIAPVAGGPMLKSYPIRQAVPALLMQGRDDERILWDGGEFDGSYRPAMAEVVKAYAKPNACNSSSTKSLSGPSSCQEMQCSKAPLRWCGVQKVGHQWPGGKTFFKRMLGPNRQDVDATEMVFSFFAQHD
nr:hypothetical protein [Oceanococcus sp. HetDA_MAG_MS8]